MRLEANLLGGSLPDDPPWERLADIAPDHAPRTSLAQLVDALRSRQATFDEQWTLEERGILVETLESRLAPYQPHVAVLDALRLLKKPDVAVALATVAPGWLGGTRSALHAALQVARLAEALTQACERPFVPILWIDADDWTTARVHPAWMLNEHEDPRRIGLSDIADDRTPHGLRSFDPEHDRLAAALSFVRLRTAREPHAQRALELLTPRSRTSWSQNATRVALELFGHRGVLVVDPEWLRQPLSQSLADLFGPAHARTPVPWRDCWPAGLRAVAEGLAGTSRPSDAQLPDELPLAARITPPRAGARHSRARPMHWTARGLCFDDEPGSRTAHELAAEIVTDPAGWIPSPALRPWLQGRVLPVAAQIVDWPDACALARLAPLAARLPWTAPPVPLVPRLAVTLVEPHIEDALARTEVSVQRALTLGSRLVERETPGDSQLVQQLDALATRISDELRALARGLDETERRLSYGLRRTARRLRDELAELRERARRLHANRAGKNRRQLGRIARNLRPRDQHQEDLLGPLLLLARYGTEFVDDLYAALPAVAAQRLVVRWADNDPTSDPERTRGTA